MLFYQEREISMLIYKNKLSFTCKSMRISFVLWMDFSFHTVTINKHWTFDHIQFFIPLVDCDAIQFFSQFDILWF